MNPLPRRSFRHWLPNRHSQSANAPPVALHANVNCGSRPRTHITIVPFPPMAPSEDGPSSSGPACWGRRVQCYKVSSVALLRADCSDLSDCAREPLAI